MLVGWRSRKKIAPANTAETTIAPHIGRNGILARSPRLTLIGARRAGGTPALREWLVQRIGGQSTQQLGVEIGGLLRHYFPGKRDVANLRYWAWIHQECDIRCSLANLGQRLGGVAQVRKVLLVADRFFRELQHSLEQTPVQLHDIQ